MHRCLSISEEYPVYAKTKREDDDMAVSPSQSALAPSQRMRVAYLLTFVGGYLDAYTYFKRGGVFANAQTGNIVKLGIALANGSSEKYLQFLIPILCFALGLLTSLALTEYLERRQLRLVRRSVLVAECVGLALVGFIPLTEDWNLAANSIVSYVAAMQYETFTVFRGESIVTTMSTGNLRKCIDNLFMGCVRHDRRRLLSAARYLSIIATFAFGAFAGTRVCDLLERSAVLPVILVILVAIGIITVLRRNNVAQ